VERVDSGTMRSPVSSILSSQSLHFGSADHLLKSTRRIKDWPGGIRKLSAPTVSGTKLAAEGTAMKVNIACGREKLFGFVNVDADPWVRPDVVAVPMDLPFERGSITEMHAARVLEHLADPVAALRYWRGLLAPGGVLWVSVADARAACEACVGNRSPALVAPVLTHRDEWRSNHCFTPYFLSVCLRAAGFREIVPAGASPHARIIEPGLLTYRAVRLGPVQQWLRRFRSCPTVPPLARRDPSLFR
jgi:hypothetical protein